MKQLPSLLPSHITLLQDQPRDEPALQGLLVVFEGAAGVLAVLAEHPTADKARGRLDVLAGGCQRPLADPLDCEQGLLNTSQHQPGG